jgi:uncharacterized protein
VRYWALIFVIGSNFVCCQSIFAQTSALRIDTHTHLFSPAAAKILGENTVTAQNLIPLLDSSGIQKGVVFSAAYFFRDLERAKQENDFLATEVATHRDRLIGFCSVHLGMSWALQEIERCSKVLNLRGLKLHPQANGIDLRIPENLKLIPQILDKAGELGLPVVFDSVWLDSRITLEMTKIVLSHPQTKVIFAHSLFKDYRDLSVPALIYQMYPSLGRNLYVDLSAVSVFYAHSPEREDLVWYLRQFGIKNVLFGSDYPAFTPAQTLESVRTLPFTADELEDVLGRNAKTLLDL